MSKKVYLVAALVVFALAAVPGFADPIFVYNFSFETLPEGGLPLSGCGAGCSYSTGAIPFWTGTGGGQFQPGTAPNAYFTTLSDGITNAYSNANGDIISQTIAPLVVLGDVYTLQVDIGHRLDAAFAGTVDLLVNGQTYLATGTTPGEGNWGVFTATYTGLSADVGQSITIELRSSGVQANFDNVRMSDALGTGVPEPASFLLIGSALLVLNAIGRRSRER